MRTRVPRSIIITSVANSAMLVVFATVVLFYMGPLDDIIATPLPILWVIYNITGSSVAANVLTTLIALIVFFALFNIFASVSRLIWVFARDNGLPFSHFFSYVGGLYDFSYRIWLMTLGASHTEAPGECASPRWNHRNMSLSHLHRQRDRLQCAHLASSPRVARIVLLPDPLHPPAQDQRPASTLWTIQARFCRCTRQHVCAMLSGLRGTLDAVPSDLASHTRQHELRGTHLWCGRDRGFGPLVHQWA